MPALRVYAEHAGVQAGVTDTLGERFARRRAALHGMSAARRIVLLVPGFPANELDSTCLPSLQSFVEALGRQVPVDTIDVVAFQYPYDRRTYSWRGIRIHALGGRNSRVKKPLTWLRAGRTARGISSEIEPTTPGVFHSFWMGECAYVGGLLARQHDWMHVVSIGGQEMRRPTIYTLLLRRSRFTLTAGSVHAARTARDRLDRDVDAVVPLGLDVDRVGSVGTDRVRDIDVLAVGSLIPVKRFGDVVEVAASLVKSRPRLRVVIVGDGPERSRLENDVSAAGLANHVSLTGRLPRTDVLRLMRRSKVLLHPSEYESQGYVFLEALACGMHVVSRDVGFIPVTTKACRCATTSEMASAIARLLGTRRDDAPIPVPTADETVTAFRGVYASR